MEELFATRLAEELSPTNAFAYFVQTSVHNGVPEETMALILLLPFLATFFAFFRNIIGAPSMDMFVPVMFSIALLESGFGVGIFLLSVIVFVSIVARVMLRHLRIMQLPKIALSILIVAISLLIALALAAAYGIFPVMEVSIISILLFLLLTERLMRLPFQDELSRDSILVANTLILGLLGYAFLATRAVQSAILLYPELTLLLIPANMLIGRYFGLRLTEYFRFASIRNKEKNRKV